jgi:hypothetical protein
VRPIPAVASVQGGVFTTAQALRAGWTESALRHAERVGALIRVRPGVYAVPLGYSGNRFVDAAARIRQQAAAVSVQNPRVPVSHGAAAALLGLSLIDPPRRVCATFPRGRRGEIAGVHRHRGRLFPGQAILLGRILLLSAARTVVDLGCELGVDEAIVAADSALRAGLATREDLAAAVELCARWPGVAAAAQAIRLADPDAESPLESLSRLRIVQTGLPTPEPQITIFDLDGHFCGRVDFYWEEFGVVGEADGMGKYDGAPDSLTTEKTRQGWVEDTGLITVRWGWADLDPFDEVATRLRNAFARGLRPDRAPRLWTARPNRTWPRATAAA